ncbi:hypothetical protein [Bradyrhizobium centrolobii]|uniref:hypothetical protein n=1 Tax=Bradyrhizobium centrolobii TaxID=1505087 RepID=UPI000A77E4B9|nr:hypothetical protein [Bradyrhizobium centrolobii]
MQDDQLLQRADKAIAESERLVVELLSTIHRAQQLDDQLNFLHRLRMQDKRAKQ